MALVGSYELLMLITRSAGQPDISVPGPDTPATAASNGHDPAARIFAADLARGEGAGYPPDT